MQPQLNVQVFRITPPVYGSHDSFLSKVDEFPVKREELFSHCEEYSRSSTGLESLDPNLVFGVYESKFPTMLVCGKPDKKNRKLVWK